MSKNTTLLTISIAALATIATSAQAALISLYDTTGDPTATTIAAGDQTVVTVRLVADQAFLGYSLFLSDPGFTGDPRFTLTNRARLATNPFTSETKADALFQNDPIDDMSEDLGYTSDDAAAAAGAYDLMSLSITTASTLAPGEYTLAFHDNSGLTTSLFEDVPAEDVVGYKITVTSVPEPMSFAYLALAGLSTAALRRRRYGS